MFSVNGSTNTTLSKLAALIQATTTSPFFEFFAKHFIIHHGNMEAVTKHFFDCIRKKFAIGLYLSIDLIDIMQKGIERVH